MLRAQALCKSYPGKSFLLGPLDFHWESGQNIALLGHNGAGKSTLFRLISGYQEASAGELYLNEARILPQKPEIRLQIGYLPQDLGFPEWVSAFDLLSYAARFWEMSEPAKRVEEALAYWDALSYQHKALGSLSYGMQKRIGLALASMNNPPLLILDEPYSGLDLYQVQALEELLRQRPKDGRLTILSTHIAATAAQDCHQAFMVQAGSLSPITGWEQQNFVQRIETLGALFKRPG